MPVVRNISKLSNSLNIYCIGLESINVNGITYFAIFILLEGRF